MIKNNPLLSIIVPVYGTEKYLDRCIKSVINQSYKTLEIIVVNDASTGNCREIVKEFQNLDPRIKYVEHEKNKGLFCARVTGAGLANGEYIAFLDSDDYLSLDFYREMISKAESGNIDIIANATVRENENGECSQFVLHKICFPSELRGDDVKKQFFSQAGACYAWHTIWNKIYKKSLWDKCMPAYRSLDQHIIMTEDIAFSSILFFNAKTFASVENGAYYYCINENASTNVGNISFEKFKKNVNDISTVFNFVYNYLKINNASDLVMEGFYKFREKYAIIWNNLGRNQFPVFRNKEAVELINTIAVIDKGRNVDEEFYFEKHSSSFCDELELIRRSIASDEIEIVSFDVFDTLLLRPVWNPEDIFKIMQREFESICPELSKAKFYSLRQLSERHCREKIRLLGKGYQDITLTEIYDTFKDIAQVSSEQALKLKELENETEISLIKKRSTGKKLLDFALSLGKKVVLTSDMYLEKLTIDRMLKKCGYPQLPLFLSSEVRLLKSTGSLFEYVVKQLNVKSQKILHIGDNWDVDILIAEQKGLKTAFLPKTKDVFCNSYHGNMTNNLPIIGNMAGNYLTVWNTSFSSIAYRSMMMLVANKLFDNPFKSWNRNSDFDVNPFVMGYYALGMHVLSVCTWMADIIKKEKINHVSFLARDGFLPMKAFEMLRSYLGLDTITINYVPCSRNALMPYIINDKKGLYSLPINFNAHTPLSLIKLLRCCCKEYDENMIQIIKNAGFLPEQNFASEVGYYEFLQWFTEEMFSEEKLEKEKIIVTKYYTNHIPEGALVFDLGYSGSIPAAISSSLNYDVVYAYVHKDLENISSHIRRNNLDIRVMYDFVPQNRDLIRELFFSELNNQCLGFVCDGENIEPVYNVRDISYTEQFVIDKIFDGALEFINDYMDSLKRFIPYSEIQPMISSMPFEGLLSCSKNIDKQVFCPVLSEDIVYGNQGKINVAEFWCGLNDESVCSVFDGNKTVAYNEVFSQRDNIDIYNDGLFIKLYHKINKIAPKGSIKRVWLKKIASVFIH